MDPFAHVFASLSFETCLPGATEKCRIQFESMKYDVLDKYNNTIIAEIPIATSQN